MGFTRLVPDPVFATFVAHRILFCCRHFLHFGLQTTCIVLRLATVRVWHYRGSDIPVHGLGFRLGFGVWGLGFGVWGLGFGV